MASPAKGSVDLRDEELTLLGTGWMSNECLRFIQTPARYELRPAKPTIIKALVGILILFPFFAGWWWIFWISGVGLEPFVVVAGGLATLLGLLGPVVGWYLRLRYLESRSPLVAWEPARDEVSLLKGKHTFRRREVHGLLLVTNHTGDGDLHCELQVLIESSTGRERHLIMTDYGPDAAVFEAAAREFVEYAGLALYIAKPETWWKPLSPVGVRKVI